MKLARKNESGQIFVLVLILLVIGPLLVVPMLQLSYTSQRYNQMVEINTLNAVAADSGVEYTRYAIYNYPGEIQQSPLNENLVINGIDVHVTAEWNYAAAAYLITSTATKAQRSVSLEVMIVVDVGLFGNVVACDGDLIIKNSTFVNELYPGESDVYTNGDITIQNSYIDGDVKASGIVTWAPPSVITGEIVEGTVVLEFPTIDAQIHEDKAKLGDTYTGNYNASNQTLGPLYIEGDLDIGNNVELTGTVYVTGDVRMVNGNTYGFGDIIAEGDIRFKNYSYVVIEPETLPIIMTTGNGTLIDIGNDTGNPDDPATMAIIYAPSGTINITQINVLGSVAAPTITLTNATLQYPSELRGRADLPGAGLDTVTYTFK